MADTSSSNTTLSHIYVNLEQISFYKEHQETEFWPIYKLEISNFWKKIRDDNPNKTDLIDEYEKTYIEYIEIWDYSPLSSYLLYMGEIIPIPKDKDFLTAILQLFSHFAITLISAKEIERLSREPYYSNKPYFCKLAFDRFERNDNVNFVFDGYSDIFGRLYPQFRETLIEYWNKDSDSYIILTKNSENSSTTDLNILFPLNILYETIAGDIVYGIEPIFSEAQSYAESLIDLGFIISNNEIERSGYEFNSEDPLATTILFSTNPEENIELKETKNQVFLMDNSKYMTSEEINNKGTPHKNNDPYKTPQLSPARPNTVADTNSDINEQEVQNFMNTPISGKDFAKIQRFLRIEKDDEEDEKSFRSPSKKSNPNQLRPLKEYIGNQESLKRNTKKLNIMLKILTQGEKEESTNEVFKNVERCPNDIERTLIKEARGGNTYMETKIIPNISGKKKIIKIIFEHNSDSNSEWITLRTYLYRLFISDTLHDFYDKSSSRVHALTKDPKNNANFLRFYQNYIQKFMGIFPEIKYYDNEGNYRPEAWAGSMRRNDNSGFNNLETIVNDDDLENVANTLEVLKKKTYTTFLTNDLKKEGKKLQEFNKILQILEQNEQAFGGYFAKPMVTDADNKSLKYFAILNEYYEQKQKSSEGYSLDSKGPLIYLKTLSHELDQATTPKIERVLKSINLDYFDRGTVTQLAGVTLASDEKCKELMGSKDKKPDDDDNAPPPAPSPEDDGGEDDEDKKPDDDDNAPPPPPRPRSPSPPPNRRTPPSSAESQYPISPSQYPDSGYGVPQSDKYPNKRRLVYSSSSKSSSSDESIKDRKPKPPPKKRTKPKPKYTESSDDSSSLPEVPLAARSDDSSLSDDMAVDRAAALQPATRWPSDDEAPRRRDDSPGSEEFEPEDSSRSDNEEEEEFEPEDSSSSSEAVLLRLPPRRAERRRTRPSSRARSPSSSVERYPHQAPIRRRRIVDSDSEEDSSSSDPPARAGVWAGGAEITKNLYSVQVQMIKKGVNEEKVFLDYEIHRELKKDTSNISSIEKSFFNLSLIHHFATEALQISLKDNVGTEKVKKWKGSILNKQRIRVPVSDRTTRRGSTSQNVKSVKTSWWSNIKNLTQKSVINNDGRKIPLPSTAAFVLECIEFCREINNLQLEKLNDFGPGNIMENIIILMVHSSNTKNYESWKEVIINRIATYRDYWWDEVGNEEISNKATFCERMLSKISRLTLQEIRDKETANQYILKLLYILGNDINSEWTEYYVTFSNKFKKLKNMSINKNQNMYSLTRTGGENDIDIDVKINNILGYDYESYNWFKEMRDEIGSLSSSNKNEDEDESSSSFGVSKLIKWMFSDANELYVERDKYNEDYKRLERPVILKMIMDSFHYINLLENKLQVESRKKLTAGQKILPIMHTMDLNCGYLCGFFTDKILNSIEYNRNYDSVVSPKTIINDGWKQMLKQQQNRGEIETALETAKANPGASSDAVARARAYALAKARRTEDFLGVKEGGSGKTRRRGDKMKSNGKITRRKPI